MAKYLKYPLTPNKSSNLSLIEDDYTFYDQNIKLFFMTNKGSRIWDKRKGTSIRKFLGRPLTDSLKNIVKTTIQKEFVRNFSNITLKSVDVTNIKENVNSFVINISYNFKKEINPSTSRSVSIKIQ